MHVDEHVRSGFSFAERIVTIRVNISSLQNKFSIFVDLLTKNN